MVAAKKILSSDDMLVLLLQYLASTSEAESNRRFTAYHDALEPAMNGFLSVRLRYDRGRANELWADLIGQHAEQLMLRGTYADRLRQRLAVLDPSALPTLGAWRNELVDAIDEASGLHLLPQTLSAAASAVPAADIARRVERSNARLSAVNDTVADALDGIIATAGFELKRKSQRSESQSARQQLVRLFNGIMLLPEDERRERLIELEPALAPTDRSGIADLVLALGEIAFMVSNLRMPMLGLLYRMAGHLATDRMRNDLRFDSLDGSGDEGEASDTQASASAGLEQILDRDAGKYFASQDTVALLHDLETSLRAPERQAFRDLAAARTDAERAKLAAKAETVQRRCTLHMNVLALRVQGYTQEEIADELGVRRDPVRTANGHIEKALMQLRPPHREKETTL